MSSSSSSSSVSLSFDSNIAHKSGLHVLLNDEAAPAGSHNPNPEWLQNPTEWPKCQFGDLRYPVSIILTHPQDGTKTLALWGGILEEGTCCVSLLQASPSDATRRWRKGPSLRTWRVCFALLNCNGYVYAISGHIGVVGEAYSACDLIERIAVSDLLDETSDAQWTTLNERLSESRGTACGVTVHDRFMVFIGEKNRDGIIALPPVEIIDTMPAVKVTRRKNPFQRKQYPVVKVTSGPSMLTSCFYFGAEVLDNKIWAVGGEDGDYGRRTLTSIQYLEFKSLGNNDNNNADSISHQDGARMKKHYLLFLLSATMALRKLDSVWLSREQCATIL